MNLVVVGTHSSQTTGYAKVMRGLVPALAARGANVHVYGIQSCGPSTYATENIKEFDAYGLERRKRLDEGGFLYSGFPKFVDHLRPDAIVLYNDPVVLGAYLKSLTTATAEGQEKGIPVFLYVDLVNPRVHESNWAVFTHPRVRGVMVFGPSWESEVRTIPGFAKPTAVVTHAVDVPILKNARARAGLTDVGDDIVFLNMNRNTQRKRLDVYACAAARFMARNPTAHVRFLANSHHESAFDLHSIALRELVACGVADPMPYLDRIMINRTMLTDERVVELHNACDVAVNCSEGEGFGLCVAEAAAVGKPVIVSGTVGAKDVFATTTDGTMGHSAYVIPPVAEYFLDGRDGIGGCAQLIAIDDLVKAFETMMRPNARATYGQRAYDHMRTRPSWMDLAGVMLRFLQSHV